MSKAIGHGVSLGLFLNSVIANCTREGKKHVSLYLTTVKKDGKRNMIYIPKKLEGEVKVCTERFFKIKDMLEEVAAINLERLLGKKNKDV